MLVSKMQWLYLLLSSLVIHSKALDIVQTKKKKELETSNESSALINAIKDQESKENDGDLWIVLVSGIPARLAYSTESDICRTYQIAKRNGIPDERDKSFVEVNARNSNINQSGVTLDKSTIMIQDSRDALNFSMGDLS